MDRGEALKGSRITGLLPHCRLLRSCSRLPLLDPAKRKSSCRTPEPLSVHFVCCLFRRCENRIQPIRSCLDSLQVRVAHSGMVVERNCDKLVATLKQELDWLLTLLFSTARIVSRSPAAVYF